MQNARYKNGALKMDTVLCHIVACKDMEQDFHINDRDGPRITESTAAELCEDNTPHASTSR